MLRFFFYDVGEMDPFGFSRSRKRPRCNNVEKYIALGNEIAVGLPWLHTEIRKFSFDFFHIFLVFHIFFAVALIALACIIYRVGIKTF